MPVIYDAEMIKTAIIILIMLAGSAFVAFLIIYVYYWIKDKQGLE